MAIITKAAISLTANSLKPSPRDGTVRRRPTIPTATRLSQIARAIAGVRQNRAEKL
jgi:hypothetical protein